MSDNYLIYDGDCPFCANYVRFSALRETVGEFKLIDARDEGAEVRAARNAGYVIDEGMLLHLNGEFFYGADCLNRLALLSTRSTLFNRLTHTLFRKPAVAKFCYPILKAGRSVTLRLLGVSRMGY